MVNTAEHDANQTPRTEPKPEELPAGDSPPPPGWQLPVAAAAWALWLVFLLGMLWLRVTRS